MGESRMNLLYLHTHDSGRYLEAGAGPRRLANIDRLAAGGVTFRNAFSAAPTCSPSRSALLTGYPPHSTGMTGLSHRGFRLRDYSAHIRRFCADQGMQTVLCGVQHIAPEKSMIGYDRVLDGPTDYFHVPNLSPDQWDRENADRVARFLREDPEQPFFLSFGMLTTHRPYPPESAELPERAWPPPPSTVPDRPETRRDMERFVTGLDRVDENVGRVLDALVETGQWDRTVVILTTDHGPPFPGMKGTLRDGGIGVSLILRIPGLADQGGVEHALVSQIDLFPTLLELIGLDPVDHYSGDGRSLLPLLRGETGRIRDAVAAETNYHANYEPARAVRTERYKYIRHYGDADTARPANVDDSPGKSILGAAGYFDDARPREQLFDLLLDPMEGRNRAEERAYEEIRRELAGRLDDWMQQSTDRLGDEPVPRPRGSRLNREDAWSAEEPTEE